jgi:hypothetical protein
VSEFSEASTTIPVTDNVQDGIQMLIRSLGMIGSLDELSVAPKYLEQLRPYYLTLQILSDILQTKTASFS